MLAFQNDFQYTDTSLSNHYFPINPIELCQSCKNNVVGFDMKLIKPEVHLSDPIQMVFVKCLDCDHMLCLTCYVAHKTMQNFKNHRLNTAELNHQAWSSQNCGEKKRLDLEIEDPLRGCLDDWPSPFLPADTFIYNTPESSKNDSIIGEGLDSCVRSIPVAIWKKFTEIEAQIKESFEFCGKVLLKKRDSLITELKSVFEEENNIIRNVEFVNNQNEFKSSINEIFGSINAPELVSLTANTSDCDKKVVKKIQSDACLPRLIPTKFRSRMCLKKSFGGTGLFDDKFTEPNGVCIDMDRNIIVADSNSNFMKVFNPNGTFQFKFGIEKLLFPNKVASHKETGNIVVIERKPAHEIKIFSSMGKFLSRFGSGELKSPRGVIIDKYSRIIILESKVMRIIIYSMSGEILKQFDVSQHLRFANSICTNNEATKIYISDNHSHCVKIFDYNGKLLGEIGGPGLTNFPTSVDMNSNNELIVTDNFNSFHLTIFSEEGKFLGAYESRMKHSRILDVCSVNNETIMFSSRDNLIYIYNYARAF